MRCPICGGIGEKLLSRTCLMVLAIGLLIGFIGGMLFFSFQIKPLYKNRVDTLQDRNEELKKGYVPPPPPSKKGVPNKG